MAGALRKTQLIEVDLLLSPALFKPQVNRFSGHSLQGLTESIPWHYRTGKNQYPGLRKTK